MMSKKVIIRINTFSILGFASLGILVFIITVSLLMISVLDLKMSQEKHGSLMMFHYLVFEYIHYIIFPSVFLFVKNPHIVKTSLNVIFG